jgi:hypothetical protein
LRYLEVSAWRTISFFGFILNGMMLVLLAFYDKKKEDQFAEPNIN